MRHRKIRWLTLVVSGFVFWLLAGVTPSTAADTAARPAPDVKVGRQIYEQHCARCHGTNGDGQGPDAPRLYPQPRNFTLGTFKFRSTASGTPPTDEDLFRTLTNGLPGSGMPAWGGLSDEERWQLVYDVKHFSPVFTERQPEPVSLAGDMGLDAAKYTEGRTIYERLQCAACHGQLGRGDGPSAASLTDDWNAPIRAADLTQGWTYRGGNAARDIYLRFTTGIDGTPMPSYAEAVSDAERWQLAYYIQSLQEPPRWERTLYVARATGALPSTADEAAWSQAPATDLGLSTFSYADGALRTAMIKAVRLQALTDGRDVVLRLAWDDRSASRQTPPDAIAVSFRPDRTDGGPLEPANWYHAPPQARDVWYWSAAQDHTRERVAVDVADRSGGVTLTSVSAYDRGRWTLLIRRPLHQSSLPGAVALDAAQPMPMAVAAWDGGHDEQERFGAFSMWIDVITDGSAHSAAHH